jgi:putative DNA primase/helicase
MSTSSTGGRFKPTKFPPKDDLGDGLEEIHDPEIRAYLAAENMEPEAEADDNIVYIDGLVAPGAGARERAQAFAALDPDEYDRIRVQQAKEIGCRVGTLDKYVAEERAKQARKSSPERPVWSVDPATEPVNGAKLFNAVESIIAKHLVLPKGAAPAMAAWVGHSWTAEASDHTPLIALLSPEPECGKSTTIKVMTRLCRNPKPASNISPAAIYYAIEAYSPMTLFIDEMDSQPDGGEACRNILNSGHERELAYVTRTEEVGGERQLVEFNTFCPKVVACIGKLKATLMSRAIIIWLRRKRPDETVAGLAESDAEFAALRSSLARWAEDNLDAIKRTKPVLPPSMMNRSADNWRELFRIADVLGGGWTEKLATAAAALMGARKLDTATIGTMLLTDIKAIFTTERAEVLKSETIVGHLEKMEDRPWPDWKGGKPMSAQQMAKVLEPFDIAPRQNWNEGRNVRGYALAQFLDAFHTYLPDPSLATPAAQNTSSRPTLLEAARPARPLEPAENRHPQTAEKPVPSTLAALAASQKVVRPADDIGAIPAFLDRRMPAAVVADDDGDGWEAAP